MSDQAVTELVINADTSGAAQFTQAMDSAEQSAGKFSGTFINMGTSIALGVGGIIAGMASLRAGFDFVGKENKYFADIDEGARNAGVSVKEFQETVFAAKSSGLTDKEFASGFEKISADITAATRGETEFGKLLKENNVSLKNRAGDTKTAMEGMKDLANLVKNSGSPDIERGVAKIAGLTKEWVPFLRQGADAVEDVKRKAVDAGVVVDDSIIAKAKDFDKEWKAATAAWDLQFKASIASSLPMLTQLAEKAAWLLDSAGRAGSFFSRALTPVSDMGLGDLQKQEAELVKLTEKMEKYKGAALADPQIKGTTPNGQDFALDNAEQFKLRSSIRANRLPGDSTLDDVQKELTMVRDLIKQKNELAGITRITVGGNGSTSLPDTDTGKDLVDRAIDSLRKHTERVQADTQAVGLGDAALAKFRAQAAETSAVQANGGEETAKQAAEFKKLQKSAEEAAAGLAKARIESSIEFSAKTAFLTPQDVQIAQQLKTAYGMEIPEALNSSYAAAMRFNAGLKDISDTSRDMTKSFASDIRQQMQTGKNFLDSVSSAAVNALGKISDKLTSMAIDKLWSNAFGGGGGGNWLSSLTGIGGSGSTMRMSGADLGAGTGGMSYPMFASGTDSAPGGWSIIGEQGPERMFVPKGAQILPNGTPRPDNDNGSVTAPVSIHIDATGADAAGLARVQQQIISLQKTLPGTIVATVKKAKVNRVL